jgi:hypothetical protein
MNTKPLKAYEVQERQEGYSTIVFATNSATARKEGAAELSIDWEDVEFLSPPCHGLTNTPGV